MNRTVLAAFLACQLAGEIASWAASLPSMAAGPLVWVIGVVFLLPGDIAATWLIEKFLWSSSLNLHQLQWFKVPCEVIINAVAWMLIAASLSRIRTGSNRKSAH